MIIIADNKIPYLKGVLEPYARVKYVDGKEISRELVRDADGLIIRTRTQCDKDLLEGSKIKFIATATIGYDHIDTHYCEANDIYWTNAPGCNSGSVYQYMASLIIHLSRKGRFHFSDKTLGIIGGGNVGKKVAHLGRVLGMEVLLNDPPRERREGSEAFVDFKTIIQKADIISLHVPLIYEGSEKTYHLIDRHVLNDLGEDKILINSARGEVVDNYALKQSLIKKKIKTAVLDVWENEPVIDRELLGYVAIGTPHIAGYSRDGKANGTAMSVRALSRFFKLGLEDWYPEDVEKPAQSEIAVNDNALSEVIEKAILFSYDVENDDRDLRREVKDFERLRGDYPVRREFHNYNMNAALLDQQTKVKLQKLGFNIKNEVK